MNLNSEKRIRELSRQLSVEIGNHKRKYGTNGNVFVTDKRLRISYFFYNPDSNIKSGLYIEQSFEYRSNESYKFQPLYIGEPSSYTGKQLYIIIAEYIDYLNIFIDV